VADPTVAVIRFGDLAVLIIYLLITFGVGLWAGMRAKTTEGYFVAGRGMSGWAVGISILGTAISSITFLAYPGSAYDGNFSRIVPGLAFPVGALMGIYVFVPFYRQTGYISAYTYFERRFGLWARVYVCLLFSLAQFWRMGLILYLLSIAVNQMSPQMNLQVSIFWIGVFVTAYTVLGGIEAVIWTDVFQTIVLILGGFAVVIAVFLTVDGGAWTVLSMGYENGKFSLFGKDVASAFDLSFSRDTLLMLFIIGSIGSVCEFALDQTHVQRYIAAESDKAARRAVWIGAGGCVPVWLLFMFVGTCLWVYYQVFPNHLPREMLADEVFPFYILHEMPNGLGGLVIAGVLAAAMSSISSCISATASVMTEDIYKRILFPGQVDSHYLKIGKTISALSGACMIVIALWLTTMRQETILEMCFVVGAMLGGAMGGMFLVGFFTTRANNFGLIVGVILSTIATCGMTYIEAKAMMWESRVSWMIEDMTKSGEIDTKALRAQITAEAEARGEKLKLADVLRIEKERIRDRLKDRIEAEFGPQPPHLGEAIGFHPFMMGVLSNLVAFVAGYLFSLLRPPKSLKELGGLTWKTRHLPKFEGV